MGSDFGRSMFVLKFGHGFILIYDIFSWGRLGVLAGKYFLWNACIYLIPVVFGVVSHIIVQRKLHWLFDLGWTAFLFELSEYIKL
jgi:hypothetical protein